MSDDLYTDGDAVAIIDDEGLSYAVRHYCSGEDFENPKTVEAWCKAANALEDLVQHLQRSTGREIAG